MKFFQKMRKIVSESVDTVVASSEKTIGPSRVWDAGDYSWTVSEEHPFGLLEAAVALKANGTEPEDEENAQSCVLDVFVQCLRDRDRRFWSRYDARVVNFNVDETELAQWVAESVRDALSHATSVMLEKESDHN